MENKNSTKFEIGKPVTDVGNKYIQTFGMLTPSNVQSTGNNTGIRMEDYALVDNITNPVYNTSVSVVVITDGHGSIPAYSKTCKDKDSERWLGGYEIAKLAANSLNEYIRRVSDFISLHTLDKGSFARVLYDSFAYAQKRCEQETCKGARIAGSTNPYDEKRLNDLKSSLIDGQHFTDLFEKGIISKNPWIDPRCLITDKISIPYGESNVTYYLDGTGKRKVLAEYGCTATLAVIVPNVIGHNETKGVGTLYLGHTGDSDAYLFYRNGNGKYDYVRLTGNHSISNQLEVDRLSTLGMKVNPPYFTLAKGPESGQSLMPSRSLGHSLLSKHGISYEPTVTTTILSPGDIIVTATDGLWASYGISKGIPLYQTSEITDENLSALRVSEIIQSKSELSSETIAEAIRVDVEKFVSRRDNLAIVVIKVNH